MSTPAPWQCPACEAWIAPDIAEHHCDPPETAPVIHVAVNVAGSVTAERDLIKAVQAGIMRGWHNGPNRPGATV